ncbi:hypothetical protein KOR42_24410 [Thalassoglobus neptunius]|uniref:Chromosome partition protein Smc n=1 Tax=Thalassoglobus neptunius TaxID=1938619 RepID=A0A5C5XAY5_9PLAN|nr:hypothetical protein [Thalassoglobus neptunius]TWT59052.1 hypothetical protein KOR42_24410 [Thalassoglobus neptunius]
MRNLPILLIWMVMAAAPVSQAQSQSPTGSSEDSPAAPAADLSNAQKQLFRDYERFEKSLYDVAEQIRQKDPEQAEILYRARSKSQEENVLQEMELISELLSPSTQGDQPAQYGPAVDRQKEVLARMETILKLLQSLDERQRLADEMRRIQELLKDTNRVIAGQKDVRAETLRGRDSEQLSEAQKKVADKADELAEKIDEQDKAREDSQDSSDSEEGSDEESNTSEDSSSDEPKETSPAEQSEGEKSESDGESSSSESSSSETGEQSSSSGERSEGEKSESSESESSGQKSEGEQQQGEQQQGEQQQGEQQQGEQQQGQQQQGQQQQQQEQQQTAGREQLEQARKEMEKAIEDLLNEQNDEAVEDQDSAIARLEELKAELEEILRQLREEEKESYLTLLEARFQNMLTRQLRVNSETVRINQIPEDARLQQNYASQTADVRKQQEDNLIDAQKALNLLIEEGSSVAFPEAVQQMNKNMQIVINRLANQDTGNTTQLVETLIAETLEEMIETFQQELEDQEREQQEGQPGQPSEPDDPSLVNQIAELKMIRSLQLQINRITQQIGTENDPSVPLDAEQLDLIDDLARRQQRIQKATYDLSVGRNK